MSTSTPMNPASRRPVVPHLTGITPIKEAASPPSHFSPLLRERPPPNQNDDLHVERPAPNQNGSRHVPAGERLESEDIFEVTSVGEPNKAEVWSFYILINHKLICPSQATIRPVPFFFVTSSWLLIGWGLWVTLCFVFHLLRYHRKKKTITLIESEPFLSFVVRSVIIF